MTDLELRTVHRTYGDVDALAGVDLAVEPGQFHCLVGPNGSGKTTLLRLVLGLTAPSSGTVVRPDGGIGCGFQRANFYRELTVDENLSVFGALVGGVEENWREHVLDTLRLTRVRQRQAGELSGGFAKKLDLALALLDQPRYLLLDEPMGDLDDVSKERLCDLLGEYRDRGNAVLVSTHHLTEFESLVDRLTVLHDGRVLLDAPRADIELEGGQTLQELYVERVLATERDEDDEAPADDGHPPGDI
jgi:ABC-2 type transport system ATP-binding protein